MAVGSARDHATYRGLRDLASITINDGCVRVPGHMFVDSTRIQVRLINYLVLITEAATDTS